jgi:DNA-binding CsgD family transcriptional regulator
MTRLDREQRTEAGTRAERGLPEIVRSLSHFARQMHDERGRARDFRQALHRARVPMVTFANDRRLLDANLASRLLVHLSLYELKRRRVDDLIALREAGNVPSLWQRLIERGQLFGVHELAAGGATGMRIVVVALANVLPGEHLVVLAPADWPDDELLHGEPPAQAPAASILSGREREVIALVASGFSLSEIAEQLTISEATVRTHLGNANRKLGARNRAHAVALVLKHGLVSDSSL